MKIENIGARLYTLSDGTKVIPGAPAIEVADSHEASIKGIKELKITKEAPKAVVEEVEFKEVPTTKAELVAALNEKGIKFDQSQSKAELQALYDSAK